MHRIRKKCPPVLWLLFCTMVTTPAVWANTSVVMESHLGFDGRFHLNAFTPVTMTLENRGGSVSGTLEVVMTSGSEYYRNLYDTHYTRDVTLPSNSKKQYAFTVRLDAFSRPLIIRFKQSDRIIVSESIELRDRYTNSELVIGVGRNLRPLVFDNFPGSAIPVTVRPPYLPETHIGYQGVAMMVMDAGIMEQLTDKQFDAVYQWVETGGYVIIAGGLNLGFYSHPRLRRLLPLTVHGVEKMSSVQSMQSFCGSPLSGTEPFLVLDTTVAGGNTMVVENGIPIVTQKKLGAGQLVFLSFDYRNAPFSDWAGRLNFWEKILGMGKMTAGVKDDDIVSEITGAIAQAAGFRFPGGIRIFFLGAGYIVACFLAFRNMESRNRPLIRQFALVVGIILSFTAGTVIFFHHAQYTARLRYNGFLRLRLANHQMIAEGNYTIGLYGIRDTDIGFSLDQAFHPILPVSVKNTEDTARDWLQLHESRQGQQVKTRLSAWSQKHYTMQTWMQFPLSGRVIKEGTDIILEVNNSSAHRIVDCRLYYAGRLISIGDLEPDMHHRQRITGETLHGIEPLSSPYLELIPRSYPPGFPTALFESVHLNVGEDLITSVHGRFQADADHACLLGWIGSEVVPLTRSGNPVPGESLTFIELSMSLRSEIG